MSGPAPEPTELTRKKGNPSRKKLPALASVTVLPASVSPAPAHLSETQKELWDSIKRVAFWISGTDEVTLQLLCEKLDRRASLIANLQSSDYVLFTPQGYAYANPLVGMISTIENEITKLFSVLGLTPADRTRLGVGEVKARSKLDELIAQRNTVKK